MRDWLAESPERVLLVGDSHRSRVADEVMAYAAGMGAQVVLQLGDLGWEMIGPWSTVTEGREIETRIPAAVAATGIPFYWIDGNHDRSDLLAAWRAEERLGEGDPLEMGPGVVHLPRGYRLPWGGRGWLCVGGAVSVDRYRRQAGVTWFPQEANTAEQIDRIITANPDPVSAVAAHDAPWAAGLRGRRRPSGVLARRLGQDLAWEQRKETTRWPQDLIEESDAHQRLLRRLADACLAPGGVWAHGHYHVRYSDIVGRRRWRVEGLGAAGQPMETLCLLVDAEGRPIA